MVVLFIPESSGTFEEKVQQLNQVRLARSCIEGNLVGDGENEGHPLLDSYLPFTFAIQIGIIASGILVIILLLGAIKGLMGLFIYPPIGMLGLGYLVDLPRVLNKYQENELEPMKVVYDTVGWPIHPQTGKRTVRAVTKRTEFCINVIFFLAFPLVIIIGILSTCFAHKTYDEDDGGECYHKVNTIMLSDTPSLKVLAKGCTTKGVGGSYEAGGKLPCPTKGSGPKSAAGCDKTCKNLPKSSSTPTNSKSKSSSSGQGGKSAMKSPKSSAKSDKSDKSKSSKSKSSATKGSTSKSKSNKSKNPKAKGSSKGSNKKKPDKAKPKPSKSAYKDNDSAEDADTQYVLAQMQESEMSLEQ